MTGGSAPAAGNTVHDQTTSSTTAGGATSQVDTSSEPSAAGTSAAGISRNTVQDAPTDQGTLGDQGGLRDQGAPTDHHARDVHPPTHDDSATGGEAKRVQSPDQGQDPAVVGEMPPGGHIKLTGTAEPGSHSALFGLTPDGKKSTETSSGSGAPHAAHSTDSAVGGGRETTEGDTGSRAPTGGEELKEQFNKAETDTSSKGLERTEPAPQGSGTV